MKKVAITVTLFLIIFGTLLEKHVFSSQKGTIIFCKSVSAEWQPVEESKTFDTNTVSCIAYSDGPFNTPQLSFSIYKKNAGEGEKLLKRENVSVRPTWDTLSLQNIFIPEEGDIVLTLETVEGKVLSTGALEVTKKTSKIPPVEKAEVKGTTIEDIFNKYKPTK